jgi:hypothetical protein
MLKKRAKAAPKPSTAVARKKKAVVPPASPPPDLIAQRAYEKFIEEGGSHGRDLDHWLAAEAELGSMDNGQ